MRFGWIWILMKNLNLSCFCGLVMEISALVCRSYFKCYRLPHSWWKRGKRNGSKDFYILKICCHNIYLNLFAVVRPRHYWFMLEENHYFIAICNILPSCHVSAKHAISRFIINWQTKVAELKCINSSWQI